MQILQPLTFGDVCLPARYVLHVLCESSTPQKGMPSPS